MMWRGSEATAGRGARSRPVRQLVHDEMLNARMRARRAQDEKWGRITGQSASNATVEHAAKSDEESSRG